MLSNFNFGVGSGYQCTPSIDFNFTTSGTTTSGFEFVSYDIDFPSIYYTYKYDIRFGIEQGAIYKILPGDDNNFTSTAVVPELAVMTSSGTMYEVDTEKHEVIDLAYFASFINDSAIKI